MQLHLGWNSETGNTIDLLREFIDHCNTIGLAISSVQQLTQKFTFHEGVWVFFVSTTGQGNPPYSMRLFWRQFMKKNYKLPHSIQFCVYSLGDSSYGDDFGMTARKLRQRLKMLGAVEIAQIGLGDDLDVQGYRQVYLASWRDKVSQYLTEKLLKKTQKQYAERVTLRDRANEIEFVISDVQELSQRKSRKVCWVQLTLPEKVAAKQGDTIEIYPHNRPEDVQYMLRHLKCNPKTIVQYNSKLISLNQLLYQELNISSVLNYYFFANCQINKLVSTAKDPLYGKKIQQFITNYEEYFNYIKKYRRNITEFLMDFQCELDLDYLIRHINEVVGRKYSIARVQGNKVWLLVKLVEEEIAGTKFYRGVCSHDLITSKGQIRRAKLLDGDITPKQFRDSNIIIAMGTGIAPFIWALDRFQNRRCLLIYTNSYSDEIYHRMLVKNNSYEQIVSCTREGGQRMVRLLEDEKQRLIERIKAEGNIRIFYCGPKQIYQFIVNMVSQILSKSLQEVKRSKLIVYQNW